MVSTQRSDYEDPTRLYSDDEGFQSWWSRQAELKENVRKVCNRYGQSLNSNVPLKEFMFDSNSKLLFCRNAKVNTIQLTTQVDYQIYTFIDKLEQFK